MAKTKTDLAIDDFGTGRKRGCDFAQGSLFNRLN
jgi:EAL domain-containing protein (putative c-di-GMP-specific phosphodiesterase class I)